MKVAYSLLTFLSVAFVAAGPIPAKHGPVITKDGIQGLTIPNTNFARGEVVALEDADLVTKRAVDAQDAASGSLEARHKKKKAGAAATKKKGKGAKGAAGAAGNATAAAASTTAAANTTAAAANGTTTTKKHGKGKGKAAAGAGAGGLGGLLGDLLGRKREVRRSVNLWEAEAMRDAVGP